MSDTDEEFVFKVPKPPGRRFRVVKPLADITQSHNSAQNIAQNVTQNVTPSVTPCVTENVTPSVTQNVTSSVTPNVTPSVTENVTQSPTSNVTPIVIQNVPPSLTPVVAPTVTQNVTPSIIPNVTPSFTQNVTPSLISNVSPRVTRNVTPIVTHNIGPILIPNVTQNVIRSVTQHVIHNVPSTVPKRKTDTELKDQPALKIATRCPPQRPKQPPKTYQLFETALIPSTDASNPDPSGRTTLRPVLAATKTLTLAPKPKASTPVTKIVPLSSLKPGTSLLLTKPASLPRLVTKPSTAKFVPNILKPGTSYAMKAKAAAAYKASAAAKSATELKPGTSLLRAKLTTTSSLERIDTAPSFYKGPLVLKPGTSSSITKAKTSIALSRTGSSLSCTSASKKGSTNTYMNLASKSSKIYAAPSASAAKSSAGASKGPILIPIGTGPSSIRAGPPSIRAGPPSIPTTNVVRPSLIPVKVWPSSVCTDTILPSLVPLSVGPSAVPIDAGPSLVPIDKGPPSTSTDIEPSPDPTDTEPVLVIDEKPSTSMNTDPLPAAALGVASTSPPQPAVNSGFSSLPEDSGLFILATEAVALAKAEEAKRAATKRATTGTTTRARAATALTKSTGTPCTDVATATTSSKTTTTDNTNAEGAAKRSTRGRPPGSGKVKGKAGPNTIRKGMKSGLPAAPPGLPPLALKEICSPPRMKKPSPTRKPTTAPTSKRSAKNAEKLIINTFLNKVRSSQAGPSYQAGPSSQAGPSYQAGPSSQAGPTSRAGPSYEVSPRARAGPSCKAGPSSGAGSISSRLPEGLNPDINVIRQTAIDLLRDLTTRTNELQQLREEHNEIRNKNKRLEWEYYKITGTNIDLSTYNTNLNLVNTQLTEQLDGLASELRAFEIKYKKLENKEKENSKELKRLENIEQEYAELRVGYDLVVSSCNDMSREIQRLRTRCNSLNVKLEGHLLRRLFQNRIQNKRVPVKVYCRVRAPGEGEINRAKFGLHIPDLETVEVEPLTTRSGDLTANFTYDHVIRPEITQEECFEELLPYVQSAIDGYDVCIFAYGQTGSGKSYTLLGEGDGEQCGIMDRALTYMFQKIEQMRVLGWTYEVEACFLEVYEEVVRDMLNPTMRESPPIGVENTEEGLVLTNIRLPVVTSLELFKRLMNEAVRNRAASTANFEEQCRKSHAVYKLNLTAKNTECNGIFEGAFILIDLAGSELARMTSTPMMEDTAALLPNLGTVLTRIFNRDENIPFENSKLTYLLRKNMGDNSKILLIANVSPFENCYRESLKTLRFTSRIKKIWDMQKTRSLLSTRVVATSKSNQ